MKIVINKCYGGFSLSHEGMMRYAEIKGIRLWPESGRVCPSLTPTYWTVAPENRFAGLAADFNTLTMDERVEYNKKYREQTIYDRDLNRSDPALVQTVEELGDVANGDCAKLAVIEIPDGVEWEIDEYDGYETVDEVHRSWG